MARVLHLFRAPKKQEAMKEISAVRVIENVGFDRCAHARRHHDRVPRLRHRGVEEYSGASKLHRNRGIRSDANAGVEYHRHGRTCTDDLDHVLITDAKPGTDGGTKRHYGDRARIG